MKSIISRKIAVTARWALVALPSLLTTGCGGESPPAKQASGVAVSESEHQKFEQKYTEMCVKSQQENSDSPIQNDQELGNVCRCMAQAVSKRLSKAEAVHFLDKKEVPIDLVMMGNAASNICTQQAN